MIRSFRDAGAERILKGEFSKRYQSVQKIARRKLIELHSATKMEDLARLPGNRLEALKGGRRGQFSLRINGQYRICFRWSEGNAENVEIVDYH